MKVRLGDYIREYSVRNKENKDIPVYSVTNTQGFCKDYFGKEVASKDKTTYKIVPKGYFAYNPSRINVGSVDWQKEEEKVIVSPLYNVFSVAEEIEQQYLYYYLKSDITLQRIRAVSTGSVRDNLKLNMLYEFPINLPTKEEQRYIVKILDRARQVIVLRKKEVDMLNDLIKARFVEMFGDPIRNTHNRHTTEFSNVVKMQRGFDLPVQARQRCGDIPVYGSNGVLDYHNVAKIQGGGVITGRSGTIGKVFYTEGDYWPLNTSLFSVDTHGNNVIYLAYLLQMFDLSRFVEGTGVPTLNRNMFHDKQIIDVSRYEQEQFADFVKQVDKSKLMQQYI